VHIIDIGVGVYALLSRVLASEDKIFSITQRLEEKAIFQGSPKVTSKTLIPLR
jgi:hypothetical protein